MICFIIGNFEFCVVNYVAIGYIILMVSVRALVVLCSHGKDWETMVSF